MTDAPALLRKLFDAAVADADPMLCLPATLPPKPDGRVVVIGAGKASARMAEAVESEWGPCEGLVITRDGYGRPTQGIRIVEASHPVPDQRGVDATAEMLALLDDLDKDTFVLALISGGASALLVQPAGDITLAEKQAINSALLSSGAPISQMNTVRKHLSRVKGGQLAAAAFPARMLALVISDVPGDDPAFIASGPTVPDRSTPADARAILDRWKIPLPASVAAQLGRPSGICAPSDPRLARTETVIVAAPSQSLARASGVAEDERIEPRLLGDAIEGEAREVAREQAQLALDTRACMKRGDRPVLLLSGGECTVTRTGNGVGGPNAEFALALAIALDGQDGIHAIACDTDGVDGAAEVAGAIVTPDTLSRARKAGLDPERMLEANDAHSFFSAIQDQVITGPTLTNVNDFRAILIEPPA
ncbi:glycerate kinase type-2 family protein [Chachezhania sediminis]|uniref:glycerate kinase type-2 family protein n=1 Tax=Chachezhania sediminis TaxID=2599291 RepID=UPI00131D2E83|nr:glycerate kinase [Chachezhania sediminis]